MYAKIIILPWSAHKYWPLQSCTQEHMNEHIVIYIKPEPTKCMQKLQFYPGPAIKIGPKNPVYKAVGP